MIKYKKYVCLNFLIFNCAAARAYFNFNTKEEDVIFINNLLKIQRKSKSKFIK